MSAYDVDSLVRTWLESWSQLRDVPVERTDEAYILQPQSPEQAGAAQADAGQADSEHAPSAQMTLLVQPDPDVLTRYAGAVQGQQRLSVFTDDLPAVLAQAQEAGLERETVDFETLMVTSIQNHDVEAPKPHLDELGYEVSSPQPGVFTASLLIDGQEAAVGTVTVIGETAIFDRVRTVEEHRRRGLASLAMQILVHAALEQEAETGLLAAGAEGRKFYEELGWDEVIDIAVLRTP